MAETVRCKECGAYETTRAPSADSRRFVLQAFVDIHYVTKGHTKYDVPSGVQLILPALAEKER